MSFLSIISIAAQIPVHVNTFLTWNLNNRKTNLPFSCSLPASGQPAAVRKTQIKTSVQENSFLGASTKTQTPHSLLTVFNPNAKLRDKRTLQVYMVHVCGRTVMLVSITSDSSQLPEALAVNIIKSFLFINVTRSTPENDEQPCVLVADAWSQLRVCVSTCWLVPPLGVFSRFNIWTCLLTSVSTDVITVDLICEAKRIKAFQMDSNRWPPTCCTLWGSCI